MLYTDFLAICNELQNSVCVEARSVSVSVSVYSVYTVQGQGHHFDKIVVLLTENCTNVKQFRQPLFK